MLRPARDPLKLLLLGILVLVAACVSTNLAPIGSSDTFVAEQDERRLWKAGSEVENKIIPDRMRYDEPQLEAYLQNLVDRLTPSSYEQARGERITVRVRKDPRLNALAMPHGVIVVHTGLLSVAETEGQLAGVLAHEITHVTHRHAVRSARAIQNRETAATVASFLGTLALAAVAADQAQRGRTGTAEAILEGGTPALLLGLKLTLAASVSGYSRDQEREADEEGVKLMAAAGYDPRQYRQFLATLLRRRPDAGRLETFFYGSHPRTSERIEHVEGLLEAVTVGSARSTSQQDFDRRLLGVRVANATYDAHRGRLTLARQQIGKVLDLAPPAMRPVAGANLQGLILGAAAYGASQRDENSQARELFDEAEREYQKAISMGSTTPGATGELARAYRLLGLLHSGPTRTSRHCDAKRAFERYLEMRPNAPDAGNIRGRLSELQC